VWLNLYKYRILSIFIFLHLYFNLTSQTGLTTGTRTVVLQASALPRMKAGFCPVLSYVFASLFAGILVIVLHGHKDFRVSFLTKK